MSNRFIKIMDYAGRKTSIEVTDFENVVKLIIDVISGDEILKVLYRDYTIIDFDSSDCRLQDFNDDSYCVYDTTKNVDYLDIWGSRVNSYDRKFIKEHTDGQSN